MKEQPGSASVVQGVTEDRFGIGYSGIGYKTSGVRAARARGEGRRVLRRQPTTNVTSGKYPLSRFLYIYVNKAPGKPLDPLVREFLKLIFSKEGQEVVVKDGYLPLPAGDRRRGAEEARVAPSRSGRGRRSPAPGRVPSSEPDTMATASLGVRERMAAASRRIARVKLVDRAATGVITLRRRLHHPQRPRSSSSSSSPRRCPLFRRGEGRAARRAVAGRRPRRGAVARPRSRSASTSTSATSTSVDARRDGRRSSGSRTADGTARCRSPGLDGATVDRPPPAACRATSSRPAPPTAASRCRRCASGPCSRTRR